LRANDTDVDGDTLSVTGVSHEQSLSAHLANPDVAVVDPTYCGPAGGSFDYSVTDGSAADTGHVTVDRVIASTLSGTDANEILIASEQKNIFGVPQGTDMDGGKGDDILIGSSGDEVLVGGKGADVLKGDAGADTFKWSLGDAQGSGDSDVIKDFKINDGDVLNLKDLLQGEEGKNPGYNLDDYMTFAKSGADTVLTIDTNKTTVAGGDAQTITFENTNLFVDAGLSNTSSHDLIAKLIKHGNLKVDN
jgi:hypothetical protein